MKEKLPHRRRNKPLLPSIMVLLFALAMVGSVSANGRELTTTAAVDAAQKITGKVVSETGETLIGVSILVKGTTDGTVTDVDGQFELDLPNNAILVFSFIGFETQEVAVGTNTSLRIVMTTVSNKLNEVVVVGYGSQKRRDLTGAVSTVSSKDMENRSNTQFGYALEGKAAGVQVIRSSGQPQAGFSIRVRGTASITSGSDPLYVVDGVPTYNISELNPADIENISILKDAASAAVYGSSGANGVVLITTKRGLNQKLKLTFNSTATWSKVWKKQDMLTGAQFQELATEMGESTDWAKYNANTNWQDEVFRTAFSQNFHLAANGGTAKTSYYVSGSFANQNGVVIQNSLKRGTVKLNLDHTFSKYLKVGTSLGYDKWADVDVPENQRNGVIARLYTSIPNIGIRNPDKPGEYARSPFINDLENPVSTVYQPVHKFKNDRYFGNVYAESEVAKGLKLRSLFGFEKKDGIYTSFQDSVQTRYGQSLKGLAAENNYDFKNWITENTANFVTNFNQHKVAVMGGFIASRQTTDNLYKSSHDFTGAKDNSVESGNVQANPYSDFARLSHASVIGRVNYSFNDKYYLTSNFRADGSGQFSQDHKWGYFPSFSAGWRISQEDFLQNVHGLDELKIRAGWGIVGNDRSRPYAWYGLVDTLQKYLIGGNLEPAFINSTLENKDLRWEKTKQVDVGFDLSLFDYRLTFTADYYVKKTEDLLLEVTQPTSTGFSTALQNAGSLENKGVEFQLGTRNIVKQNFKWNTDFNISFNKGKVLDIVGTTLHTGEVNPAGTSLNTAIVQAGSPLGSFYGKTSLGVDPQTGVINFLKTADGGADSVGIIGNANPKFIFGLNNGFTIGNFTLNFFIQGVQGNDILNATRILSESMVLPMNQSATVLKRWKNPGDVTNMPGVSPSNWDNSAVSTRYIEDGSYVRLKALTLGYNFKGLDALKISRCQLYVTAENLLTFTKYSGFDPEVSAFSSNSQGATNQNTAPGVDFGTYPQAREFILGLNLTF
ncbi:MAG: TonB-dependent receptor [Saprospiraceae bacterium]|nr:TonB-dependent receptor [Saprospiraceae bacterium]